MWLLLLIPVVFLLALGAVLGLIATVLSALGPALPWLMIGLGVWLVLGAARRDRRQRARVAWSNAPGPAFAGVGAPDRHAGRRRDRHPASASANPTPIRAWHKPAPTDTLPKAKLPIDVQVKAEQIRRKADLLQGYADRFPPFSQDLYLVRQTASEYLPRTIEAYLSLPERAAIGLVPTTGNTALDELRAQLALLDAKLDEITRDLERRDLDRLLANRRFLEERFSLQRDGDRFQGDATEVA